MARSNNTVAGGLPPFQAAVRNVIIVSTAIYIVLVLLQAFHSDLAAKAYILGMLSTQGIHHGWIWQFLTFGFVDDDPRSFVFTMVSIYFLGSAVQARVGARSFLELYLGSLVCSGVLGFLLSLSGAVGTGPALGAGAASNAILMVFYLLNRDSPITLMFIPIPIPVKYIVILIGAVEAAYFLKYHFVMYYLVLLLGLASGFLWYRFAWRRATAIGKFGLQIGEFRNSYHRWKRRRAGKKFQVYMRKHDRDSSDYFDEHGNFRPPDDKDKKNGGSSGGGWVN
jgi:membrane associated rhomboid family serine protease